MVPLYLYAAGRAGVMARGCANKKARKMNCGGSAAVGRRPATFFHFSFFILTF